MKRNWLLLVLLGMLVWLQYRLWLGSGSWEEVTQLRREIAQQEQLNSELRERNERLSNEVRSLKTDLDKVEQRARSELGLIQEGETFYLIVEEDKQP